MMTAELDRLRTTLAMGTFRWSGGHTEYARDGADEFMTLGATLSLGIVLHPLLRHEGWADRNRLRPAPLEAAGMGWLVPPGATAFARWREPSDYLSIEIDPRLLADAVDDGPAGSAELPATIVNDDPGLVRLALALHRSAVARDALACEVAAGALCDHLLDRDPGPATRHREPRRSTSPSPAMRRVAGYIEAGLADRLTLGCLAAVAGFSTAHFRRRFTAEFGVPPHRYVLNRRLDAAERLLRTSPLSIAEIAFRTGFASQSHMTQQLRRLRGRTPLRIRG